MDHLDLLPLPQTFLRLSAAIVSSSSGSSSSSSSSSGGSSSSSSSLREFPCVTHVVLALEHKYGGLEPREITPFQSAFGSPP